MARQVFPSRFFVWEYRMTSARWGGEQAPLPVKRSKTRKAEWRGRVSSCRFFVREFRMTSARWGGEQAPLPVKRSKTRKAKWRGRVSSCRFFVREFRMPSESGISRKKLNKLLRQSLPQATLLSKLENPGSRSIFNLKYHDHEAPERL